ncbi:MAG: peptidoglycan-binding domain-containing protein [Rickettsiales bacterium]
MGKNFVSISTAIAVISCSTLAYAADIYSGASGAQTVHRCGNVTPTAARYTTSPGVTRIVEQKLIALGYLQDSVNGVYGKRDIKAVKRFQSSVGIKADGVVGPVTALELAYATAPNRGVERCLRLAMSEQN